MNLDGSWTYISDTARSRLAHNKTERHVYQYGEGIELIGVAGEIVARRFLGLDEKVHDRFDQGVDISFMGRKIDVKATILTPKIEFRFLQWAIWKQIKCDIILMTAIDPIHRYGTVLGYATSKEMELAPINYTRFSPCHEIPVKALHPGWELMTEYVRDNSGVGSEAYPRRGKCQ